MRTTMIYTKYGKQGQMHRVTIVVQFKQAILLLHMKYDLDKISNADNDLSTD